MIGPISSRIRVLIHLSSSHHLKIVRGALEWRRSSLFMKHLIRRHPDVTRLWLWPCADLIAKEQRGLSSLHLHLI
jgi:hypothetical protein